jgi:hypothetical protein
MPKAKPDQIIVHRIELQETERDQLALLVGANLVKSVGQGAGSFISAFTSCTVPGAILWGSVIGVLLVEVAQPGLTKPSTWKTSETHPFYPRTDEETGAEYRARTTLTDRLYHGFVTKPEERIRGWVDRGSD